MTSNIRWAGLALFGAALLAGSARADLTSSLKQGTPDIKSAGALAFAPEGILLVGDSQGAAIFALDTGDRTEATAGEFKVASFNEKVASLLGTESKEITINDLAVNPISGKAYVSVSRGRGPDAKPVILRTDAQGKMEELELKSIKFAKAALPNAPSAEARGPRGQSPRQEAITCVAFAKGKVYVAGLSNEEFAST